ncbi:MAG: hypothetical protein KDI74_00850 [Gammaproteobacteria bacterium]|nr:hypothetical protein [Gammaproteobacteria bacterium]
MDIFVKFSVIPGVNGLEFYTAAAYAGTAAGIGNVQICQRLPGGQALFGVALCVSAMAIVNRERGISSEAPVIALRLLFVCCYFAMPPLRKFAERRFVSPINNTIVPLRLSMRKQRKF